jgi:multidrug efflux pump subunit AcrA (membrane-fusion protein)
VSLFHTHEQTNGKTHKIRDNNMSDGHDSVRETVRIAAPLLILAVGAGGFFLLKSKPDVPRQRGETEGAPAVDTVTVMPHTDALTMKVDGQVVPFLEVSLSAEVGGRIVSKTEFCRAGKFVQKDQLLLQIDPGDYEREQRRLEEEVEQADVMIEELNVEIENTNTLIELAEDDLQLQQNELDRELALDDRGVTTDAAIDQAKRGVLQARNSLLMLSNQRNLLKTRSARLESGKALTRIRLEQAKADLERARIASPIDGMVVAESVQENSYVQKGTPLVTLESTSTVEVKCHLRMDQLYWIWNQVSETLPMGNPTAPVADYQLPETDVRVVYRLADEEYVWRGVLWRYDGIGVDERTRTVPCRVRVDAPRDVQLRTARGDAKPATGPPALVRGMFVALEIHARPKANLLQVDEMAVRPGNKVWRVRNGQLDVLDVQVVTIANEVAVLRAETVDLRIGDKVVVSPLAETTDGMAVDERETEPATEARETTPAEESETK